jgi:hypothetical protein
VKLTLIDAMIWRYGNTAGAATPNQWHAYELADRRDADLMLHAQRHKILAALRRTDDGLRIDLRLGTGHLVGHLGITLPARGNA